MSHISPEVIEHIISFTKSLCHNYLTLYQDLSDSDNSDDSDEDFFIGMGVRLDDLLPEEQLDSKYRASLSQLQDYLNAKPTLTSAEKRAIFRIVNKGFEDFCKNVSQEKIDTFGKKLQSAMRTIFPESFDATKQNQHLNAIHPQKKQRREGKPPLPHLTLSIFSVAERPVQPWAEANTTYPLARQASTS